MCPLSGICVVGLRVVHLAPLLVEWYSSSSTLLLCPALLPSVRSTTVAATVASSIGSGLWFLRAVAREVTHLLAVVAPHACRIDGPFLGELSGLLLRDPAVASNVADTATIVAPSLPLYILLDGTNVLIGQCAGIDGHKEAVEFLFVHNLFTSGFAFFTRVACSEYLLATPPRCAGLRSLPAFRVLPG